MNRMKEVSDELMEPCLPEGYVNIVGPTVKTCREVRMECTKFQKIDHMFGKFDYIHMRNSMYMMRRAESAAVGAMLRSLRK